MSDPSARLNSMPRMSRKRSGSRSGLKLILNILRSSFPTLPVGAGKEIVCKGENMSLRAFLFFHGRGP